MLETSHINPALADFGDKFTQLEPDSMTVEEGDFLYGLVRMCKPYLAVETGTGHGGATKRIGEALKDNKHGFLLSCDTDPDYINEVAKKVQNLPVDIRCTTGIKTLESFDGQQAGFILVDAGNVQNRMEELRLIVQKHILSPKGLLVVHDAINPNYARLVEYMKYQNWPGMVFETLAGIAVYQHP
jgi:predicted O-methyltransferase YrrM